MRMTVVVMIVLEELELLKEVRNTYMLEVAVSILNVKHASELHFTRQNIIAEKIFRNFLQSTEKYLRVYLNPFTLILL